MSLESLPNETLIRVLSDVRVQNLACCRRVCRRLQAIIDDTPLLQFVIECSLSGVLPTWSSKYDLSTSLEILQSWRDATISLACLQKHDTCRVNSSDGTPGATWVWGNVMVQNSGTMPPQYSMLPRRYKGAILAHGGSWSSESHLYSVPQNSFGYSGVEGGQDLLVAVQKQFQGRRLSSVLLHTVTLSSGSIHPEGISVPIYVIFDRPLLSSVNMRLSISGDYIGAVIWEDIMQLHSELWVWNWKTGQLKLNLYGAAGKGRRVACSLTFLDERHILVPMWSPTTRDVDPYAVILFDYIAGTPARTAFEDASAAKLFQLPKLLPYVDVREVSVADQHYPATRTSEVADAPFSYDMRSRLLVISFRLNDNMNTARPEAFQLFVTSDILLRHCTEQDSVTVRWDDWAPHCRFFNRLTNTVISSPHVFHQRCIVQTQNYSGQRQDPESLDIYDFSSPAALRRDHASGRFDKCNYIWSPQTVVRDRFFKVAVVTGSARPFRKITTGCTAPRGHDSTTKFFLSEGCFVTCDTIHTPNVWNIWSY